MKTNIYSKLLILTAIGFLFSCNPKSEGTDAEVSEAKEVEDVSASQEYTVNTEKSVVSWIGSKPTGKHNGTIPISSGTVAVEGDAIVGGSIDMNITEISNDDLAENPEMQAKLVGHLKSADFFDAENHPTANFTITSVEPYSAKDSIKVKKEFESEYKPASAKEHRVESPTHKITGNLTMRGKTLSVSFPANVTLTDGQIMAKAKFNIDRTQWGLQYGDEADVVDKAKDKFIYNTVNVGFEVVADAPSM
ncbi:YceI family protein [Fulvivirga lutea]|uniref:YceI family protein n=1 Tax=Fulvivirga lutea TaxID=2810512 RepID=A0A974WEB8_9BACT|nr:YceI family protein [Fulvivirga lutea]QSE96733.1 YceI family protein [Fulvivirga lutea]